MICAGITTWLSGRGDVYVLKIGRSKVFQWVFYSKVERPQNRTPDTRIKA